MERARLFKSFIKIFPRPLPSSAVFIRRTSYDHSSPIVRRTSQTAKWPMLKQIYLSFVHHFILHKSNWRTCLSNLHTRHWATFVVAFNSLNRPYNVAQRWTRRRYRFCLILPSLGETFASLLSSADMTLRWAVVEKKKAKHMMSVVSTNSWLTVQIIGEKLYK